MNQLTCQNKVKTKVVFIKFQSYSNRYRFGIQKVLWTLDLFPGIIRHSKGAAALPTRRKTWTVLSSPFKHKVKQDHYQLQTFRQLIWFEASAKDARKFLKFLESPAFKLSDLVYRVEEHDFEELNYYYSHPSFCEKSTPVVRPIQEEEEEEEEGEEGERHGKKRQSILEQFAKFTLKDLKEGKEKKIEEQLH